LRSPKKARGTEKKEGKLGSTSSKRTSESHKTQRTSSPPDQRTEGKAVRELKGGEPWCGGRKKRRLSSFRGRGSRRLASQFATEGTRVVSGSNRKQDKKNGKKPSAARQGKYRGTKDKGFQEMIKHADVVHHKKTAERKKGKKNEKAVELLSKVKTEETSPQGSRVRSQNPQTWQGPKSRTRPRKRKTEKALNGSLPTGVIQGKREIETFSKKGEKKPRSSCPKTRRAATERPQAKKTVAERKRATAKLLK